MNLTANLFNSYIDTIRESYHSRIERIGSLACAISRDDLILDMKILWPDISCPDDECFEVLLSVYLCIAQTESYDRSIILTQSLSVLATAFYTDPKISLELLNAQAILARYKLIIQDNKVIDPGPKNIFINDSCIFHRIHISGATYFHIYSNTPMHDAYKIPETMVGPLNILPTLLYKIIQDKGVFKHNNYKESSYLEVYSNTAELYQLIEWMFESKQQAMKALLQEWLSRNSKYDIEESLLNVSSYEKETWTSIFEHFLCNHDKINNLTDINKCIKLQHDLGVELKDIVMQLCTSTIGDSNEDIQFSY